MARDLALRNDLFDFLGLTNYGSSDFKVDIKDTDKAYIVEAELPGFNKDDIHIDFHNDVLSIEATRENTQEEKDESGQVLVSERFYGKVSRQFAIRDVDEEHVDAKYENGILKIQLPKYSKVKERKKIAIK